MPGRYSCVVEPDPGHGRSLRGSCQIRDHVRLLDVAHRVDQHVDIGEHFLLPFVIQHGQGVLWVASEVFLQTVRDLQNPADMQENPRGNLIPPGLPGGNALL